MTTAREQYALRRSRRRPRRRVLPWILRLAALALVFAAGLALGRELEENEEPSRDITFVRTLRPVTVAPPPSTVTVTERGS